MDSGAKIWCAGRNAKYFDDAGIPAEGAASIKWAHEYLAVDSDSYIWIAEMEKFSHGAIEDIRYGRIKSTSGKPLLFLSADRIRGISYLSWCWCAWQRHGVSGFGGGLVDGLVVLVVEHRLHRLVALALRQRPAVEDLRFSRSGRRGLILQDRAACQVQH